MKFRIQIVIEHEDEEPTQIVEEVGCLSRGTFRQPHWG